MRKRFIKRVLIPESLVDRSHKLDEVSGGDIGDVCNLTTIYRFKSYLLLCNLEPNVVSKIHPFAGPLPINMSLLIDITSNCTKSF